MKSKKLLSLLLAVTLVVSAAAIALAESVDTPAETVTADDAAAAAATPVYTLDEMLSQAIADVYARQAAYAAYAAAFPDSRAIANVDVHTQIVLLEMLLKAHDMALPEAPAAVTAPATETEAIQLIADSEANTVALMKSYLAQEALSEDAQMIFRSVLAYSHDNAAAFRHVIRAAKRAEEWAQFMNGEGMQKYVVQGQSDRGNGSWTVYVYTNDPGMVPEGAQPVDETTAAEPTATPVTETTGN